MTASGKAALTGAMPKSPQMENQCVWIRPLVDKPQTKKVKNRTQKVAVFEASRSAASGEEINWGGVRNPLAPNARRERSLAPAVTGWL
jgi:hypothetical protein